MVRFCTFRSGSRPSFFSIVLAGQALRSAFRNGGLRLPFGMTTVLSCSTSRAASMAVSVSLAVFGVSGDGTGFAKTAGFLVIRVGGAVDSSFVGITCEGKRLTP